VNYQYGEIKDKLPVRLAIGQQQKILRIRKGYIYQRCDNYFQSAFIFFQDFSMRPRGDMIFDAARRSPLTRGVCVRHLVERKDNAGPNRELPAGRHTNGYPFPGNAMVRFEMALATKALTSRF
jgi:hypothetical protein